MNEGQIKEFSGEQECIIKYLKTPKVVEFKSLEEYLQIYTSFFKEPNYYGGENKFTIENIEEV